MADVTIGERLADLREKLRFAAVIGREILFGGQRPGWVSVRGQKMLALTNVPNCIGDLYRKYLKANAGKEWLIYQSERMTFAEAEQVADGLGAELAASYGVGKGSKVGIVMSNMPEFIIAFLGVTAIGAVAVPLNFWLGAKDLEVVVKDSGCSVLIADADRLRVARPFLRSAGVRQILVRASAAEAADFGAAQWADVVAAGRGKPRPSTKDVDVDDEVMIMYTSGSTGRPKGVVHTQRSLGHAILMLELSTKMLPDSKAKSLLSAPLFHITSLVGVAVASMPRAEAVVIMQKWDAGEGLRLIETEQCSRFTGVPTMVADMLSHPEYRPERLASMKNFVVGGSPVPTPQVSAMRKKAQHTGNNQVYGSTEMIVGTTNRGVDYLKHPNSAGKPVPLLTSMVIKDPETGKTLPRGARGEICVRGPTVMKCYHNQPEETAKVFDSEGYLHTGDVGRLEGGFLYILDRMNDIINRGGEKIDCSEVESALHANPLVKEVSVFGLPDERLGEVVAAAVFVDGSVTTTELSDTAAASLAKYKVPLPEHIFTWREALPKGATGKIDKKGLRERYRGQMCPPRSRL